MINTDHIYSTKARNITRLVRLITNRLDIGARADLYAEIESLRHELIDLHAGNHMMQRPYVLGIG